MATPLGNKTSALVELKRRNEWTVLDAVRTRGAMTRAELVRTTGLSRSTIANVVVDLQQRGFVDELVRSEPTTGPGRYGGAVSLRSSAGMAIGIAIDRSSLRTAAVDLAARVVAERIEPIPPDATGAAIVDRCAIVARELMQHTGTSERRLIGVGIGIPGPVDLDFGGVHPSATLHRWAGLDVRSRLSHALGGCHVFPDNDANYGAVGEHEYGAARGARDAIYLNVGPGIGGGLIIDGQLRRGDRGFAGEIGHTTAVENGPPCPCGRRGCLAAVASSGAIISQLESLQGRNLSSSDVLALADGGDRAAIAALQQAGEHVGRALSSLVNALNPRVIVLGGDLGARSSHLLKAASRSLTDHVQPIAGRDLHLEHTQLDHRAEVLGAAARVLRDAHHLRSYLAAA